ncbi:MAG: queuosine precursor transporter [Candidatus Omnitrophica bacterium]|nr:queuosine precursor transporter [Candidatus Omnitrophota bacterium]
MNETYFVLMSLISLGFMLLAFRLGKSWVVGLIAVNAVLMNIFVLKGMYLFGLAATGGNVLYASIFLGTDLLAEYYGKKEAMRAVMVGFFASLFFLVMSQFILKFVPADYDFAQDAFKIIFTLTPRIIAGSMIAYLISQNLDVWLFHKIKKKTGSKHLWLRNNGSTWASQAIDSVVFTLIAFWGVFPDIWQIILFTYIIKIIVAAIDTPFIYLSKKLLPKELKK